ncbi:hypothetical protein ACFWWB_19730 [Streptomyces sp. NPDC058690]|uniref:hypothetical protein n=1 Tax=Streptomyces sp. NPDC058690 TaxID=3346600 RepID=UPI0036536A46
MAAASCAAVRSGSLDDATELLERELLTAAATSGRLNNAIGRLDDKRATLATAVVLSQLSGVDQELAMSDPVGALSALAELTCAVGGEPILVTQAEFDRRMADEDGHAVCRERPRTESCTDDGNRLGWSSRTPRRTTPSHKRAVE